MLAPEMQLSGDPHRPLFERVADMLRHLITTGSVKDGAAMPSVRDLLMRYKGRMGTHTVQAAYDLLEREGYLESIPRRGYFAVTDPKKRAKRRQREIIEAYYETRERLSKRGFTDDEQRAALEQFVDDYR